MGDRKLLIGAAIVAVLAIVIVIGLQQRDTYAAEGGAASTPFRGVKPGSSVRTFRADGTAVVCVFIPQGSTGLGATDYTLTRLADGASVTFQDLGGLAGSVRLR